MDDVVILKDVSKSFKGHTVLDDISISFERNKIHGIVGRNGSGKTVLIKTICGFVKPDEGEVIVDGEHIGEDVDFPESVGVIIEAPGFIPTLSAYKNLRYLASIRNKIGDTEICAAIEAVGLNPRERKAVGKYSLGMRQRLGIAQAIMERPDILILDEPMNALDSEGVSIIRNLLMNYCREGHTIILISHNREDIDILCDTVSYLKDGKISQA